MALRPRRRARFRPDTSINLTPMVDMCFNLLIAFMIIAPALKHGLRVELAKTEGGQPLNPQEPVSIVIDVDPDEHEPRLYLDNDRVTMENLRARLEALRDLAPPEPGLSVLIEPDAQVPTEATLQVLGIVLDLEISNYGFVTEPQTEERR
jgi:biopolymer transport protein ExbD